MRKWWLSGVAVAALAWSGAHAQDFSYPVYSDPISNLPAGLSCDALQSKISQIQGDIDHMDELDGLVDQKMDEVSSADDSSNNAAGVMLNAAAHAAQWNDLRNDKNKLEASESVARQDVDYLNSLLPGCSAGAQPNQTVRSQPDDQGRVTAVTYDADGNPATQDTYGPQGQPALNDIGYFRQSQTFDDKHNPVTRRFFGLDGQPTAPFGYAGEAMTYDSYGFEDSESYFDVSGQPVAFLGCAKNAYVNDSQDKRLRESCFGTDGKPALNSTGWASAAMFYDGDTLNGMAYYGVDGAPMKLDGTYGIRYRENAQGQRIHTDYLGPDGQPALNDEGYASEDVSYGADGMESEEDYFDLSGHPVADKDGCFKRMGGGRMGLNCEDASGNPVAVASGLDLPVLGAADGVKEKDAYDANGRETAEEYVDASGQPADGGNGYVRKTLAYDADGNQTEEAYFGKDGQPVASKDGYARKTMTYAGGNETSESYFGTDGKPSGDTNGMASKTMAYDGAGNETGEAYFDVAGKPFINSDGYAGMTLSYDADGNNTGIAYLGADGRPVTTSAGFASKTMAYTADKVETEEDYFDLQGKPVASKDGCFKTILNKDYSTTCEDLSGKVISQP